jgi:hypothetical protein
MRTLELRGEMGRRVVVVVDDYERGGPQSNPYDANWLRCSISTEIGKFRGEVEASLTTNDFSRFSSELEKVTAGASSVASLTTMEEALTLRIEVNRAGRATVTGMLRGSDSTPPTSLSFGFESDLSFLRQAQAQLTQIVSDFPIRQA